MRQKKRRDRSLVEFQRDDRLFADDRARGAAIGDANEWLRLSMRTRNVALVLSHWDPRFEGEEWTAVLYDGRQADAQVRLSPEHPEWSSKRWQVALTKAVFDLLTDEALDRWFSTWIHRGVPAWIRFDRLDGTLLPS